MGAVQREVLYIYNPGSFLMRKTIEPVTVVDSKGHSHMVPENTLTFINDAAAARNPATWKKPQVAPARRATLSDSPAPGLPMSRMTSQRGTRLVPAEEPVLEEVSCRLS